MIHVMADTPVQAGEESRRAPQPQGGPPQLPMPLFPKGLPKYLLSGRVVLVGPQLILG